MLETAKVAGTPRIFQSLFTSGRQLIDVYTKYVITLLEEDWRRLKDIGEPVIMKMKKCVVLLKRACVFVQDRKEKQLQNITQSLLVLKRKH